MNPAVLRIENLHKYYTTSRFGSDTRTGAVVKAVDGIDFSIDRGKTLALVGESGCGKTTTAQLILRLQKPTSGRILLNGTDISEMRGAGLRAFRTRVQAVFQDPWSSLNPRIRVRDLVAEPLIANQRFSRKEIDSRVEQVLEEVGLRPEHARNYPHEFSGGQRQRIAIASALISKPDLIILDEPVSALDVSIRSQIMNTLKELQRRHGVSYLLVAHDLGTTRFMADEIAVMYLGKIVERAQTEQLFEQHSHPYTEALLSAALPDHPDSSDESIILKGEVPSPIAPPPGCTFHTRCHRMLGAICQQTTPDLLPVNERDDVHVAACHLVHNNRTATVSVQSTESK